MRRKSKIHKLKRRNKTVSALAAAEPVAIDFGARKSVSELGNSGTDIIGGFYREEPLLELQGYKAAEVYDKMRRRDAQISMILNAIIKPIVAGNVCFEIEDEADAMQVKMKELCEWNFRCGLQDGLTQHLKEVCTFIIFGHSVFEAVDKTENVPELDNALVTYYTKFGFRKQTSIHRWHLERKTGKIVSIEQHTSGDLSKDSLVNIPGEFLIVFTNEKEGDNYEGISALRPAFGAYSRKDMYLKLTAIGAEKNAIGTVIGTIPKGKGGGDEETAFDEVLQAYSTHECQYIKTMEGWKIEIIKGDFDPSKMVPLIQFENEEMARAVVANFLLLGTGSNGGAFALGKDLSDFFFNVIQSYAGIIAETHNRHSIPSLIKKNYGPQPKYPKMKIAGINDDAGKELAEVLLSLKNGQMLTPDDKLEEYLRQLYKIPKADPTTARAPLPVASPFGTDPSPTPAPEKEEVPDQTEGEDYDEAELAERAIRFAEGYKGQFNTSKSSTKELMAENLRLMADNLMAQLRKNWNALSDAQKANATKDVEVRAGLVNDYRNVLREQMATTATQAIAQARKEAPKAAKDVKFSDYDKLNPLVKRAIQAQIGLVVDTQVNDLTKVVLFQFSSSASSQTDIDGILNDVESRVAPILEGTTNVGMSIDAAAGDLVAHVTQNSRNSFFFAPEVLDTIESFTFTNEDPVSEICQNLNGQTFLATDPAAEQFYPPLHHNCKSRLVPNGKGEDVKVTGIGIIADTTEERERIAKQATLHDCEGHKLFS